jgi:uncharacterized lipoprotein YddW (UPF0748 family)
MQSKVFIFIGLLLAGLQLNAQPKRELRAAWIATVANIDWPSKPGLPSIQQQEQFIHRLEQLKYLGCNAVIVQIRPAADALYPSSLEPWCYYLTGRQGEAPFPVYDPLRFMIEETHKRNMEFHAWFNPFRALMNSNTNTNPPNHVTRKYPEWILNYGGKSYIDPGIPEARDFVIKVIADVVKRYDIDAVHLDDYFYPYRVGTLQFPDNRSYARYAQGADREEWRRNNVNQFIFQLDKNIKQIKPFVKLGISPFGVWRNADKDPEGSATRGGQTDYDDLYADVVLWLNKGWIDYLMPQLYWEHSSRSAPFDVLLPWWEKHEYTRHIYYGLGAYRMVGAHNGAWAGTKELLWQMRDIRRTCTDPGFAYYSASSFDKISAPIGDSLHYTYNKLPAFPPRMKWLDSIPPPPPVLKAIPSAQGTLLQWHLNNPGGEMIRYVVYRFLNDEPINLDRTEKIICVQTDLTEFLDVNANKFKKVTYVVTAMDRLWNESRPSNKVGNGMEMQ